MIRLRKLVRAAAVLSGEQNALLYGCWHAGSSSRGSSSSTSNKPDEPASAGREQIGSEATPTRCVTMPPKWVFFMEQRRRGPKFFRLRRA